MTAFVRDLRLAVRVLLGTRTWTLVVLLSLALGIGANTALFSLVDNLLLRSLPVRDPGRLVHLQVFATDDLAGRSAFRKPMAGLFNRAVFDAVRAQDQVIADVIGFCASRIGRRLPWTAPSSRCAKSKRSRPTTSARWACRRSWVDRPSHRTTTSR